MSSIPFDVTPDALRSESAAIRSLSRELLGHEQDAEDTEQETWLAALRHPAARINERSAWLARVARNFALRMRRKDEARRRWEREAARPESMPSTLETVERVALHQQIVDVVLGLDEPYRTTVLLRFWEDQPPRIVARLMGVPVSTVRTRVRRALAILRERLDDDCGGRAAWSGLLAIGTGSAATASVASPYLALAGVLLMTTKAKLVSAAAVCALLAALWMLLDPFGADAVIDPGGEPDTRTLVAAGTPPEDASGTVTVAEKPDRAEVTPRPIAKPTTGSLLVRARWSDKSPAGGVMIRAQYLTGQTDPSGFEDPTDFTDDEGVLRVENLRPGGMSVQSQRGNFDGGQKFVKIAAGEEAEVRIEIPRGLDLDGVVVDGVGSPVANADIIVAVGWSGGHATVLAKSGADGRFQLRSIGIWCHVGARARGYAPSLLHTIKDDEGTHGEVRIVLGARGGAIHGRVLNPDGEPVTGAVVQIGAVPREPRTKLPDGGDAYMPMPIHTRTDEEGRFVAAGLTPGETSVAVRARGLASSCETVDVVAARVHDLVVNLMPAATITGTIRSSTGQPIGKASVQASREPAAIFSNRWARSDAQGNYRLADLGPGEYTVQATTDGHKVHTKFVLVAGQNAVWNPMIITGLSMRCRVLDENDKPVRASYVAGLRDPEGAPRFELDGWTDKTGRFVLRGCVPERPIWIQVSSETHADRMVYTTPVPTELLIRVNSGGKPSVHIQGQIVQPDGRPVAGGRIVLVRRGTHTTWHDLEKDTAGFRLGPFPPGEYRVQIESRGYPFVLTGWRTLAANETWDLGDVKLARPGFVKITLRGDPGLLAEIRRVNIVSANGERRGTVRIRSGKADRSNPLAPGTYYAEPIGKETVPTRNGFEVHAGQATPLEIALDRGTSVHLEFAVRTENGLVMNRRSVDVEIRDQAGRAVLRRSAYPRSNYDLVRKLEFALRPGEYTVIATAIGGQRAELPLTVGRKPARPDRIVLR